jgi:hypothetical protein
MLGEFHYSHGVRDGCAVRLPLPVPVPDSHYY